MAASITDPRLEALVARVNAFDASTVVNLNNCIAAAIAYKHQAIVAVWPPALADEEAAFKDLLKNIVRMADKAAEQVTTLVGIKQFKDLASVDDENMRLQLNRIERRSQEIGKNNRHILANRTGRAAATFPDGQEHENAIDALAATRFLAVQAFARKLDGAGIAVHPSLCTEQWLTAHIRNKNTLKQPDDDSLAAPKKFSEKAPFTEWWTTVVRYLWRFNGVNFDTPLAYVLRESEIPVDFGAAELSGCTPLEEKYYTTPLTGSDHVCDNRRVATILMDLLSGTPAEDFCRSIKRDGRKIMIVLKETYDGKGVRSISYAEAKRLTEQAKYRGETNAYGIMKYIASHQRGQQLFKHCKEPLSEARKIELFIAGILCSQLNIHIAVIASQVEQYNTFETVSNFLSIQALNLNPRKTGSVAKVRTTPNESTHVPKDEWEAMSRAEKTAHIAKRKKKGGKKSPAGKNAKVARVGTNDKGETDAKSDLEKATAIAKTMQEQFISGIAAGRSLEADASEQQDDSQADGDGKAKPSVQKRKGKGQG
jgi:hypothetical protein